MATQYPLVLVHGILGFNRLLGFPYFFGVKRALERKGAKVFVASLSGLNSEAVRGEQLRTFIDKVLRESGKDKVNLIGHSQGALDCRYVAATHPACVASVTSVNGVNHGSEVADAVRAKYQPGSRKEKRVALAFNVSQKIVALLSGHPQNPQDAIAALNTLTTEGVQAFNQKYPQALPKVWGGEGAEVVNGIHYYSWSSVIAPDRQGLNALDPLHLWMRHSTRKFTKEAGQNDGLVGRFSSHLGNVIRSDYPMDHLDAINQLAGLRPGRVDPVELYVRHLERLAQKGL